MKWENTFRNNLIDLGFHYLTILVIWSLIGMRISNISSMYQISVIFDTISIINNRLREKSVKKISNIGDKSLIYRFWTYISWTYRVCGTRAC